MKKNSKGFTIVELVIVIAVVAVLAGVLIPTFAGIVTRANISADTQAVRNMNVILSAEAASEPAPSSAFAVIEILEENGITDFIPTTESYIFYWLKNENTVVLADGNKVAVYPNEFKSVNYSEDNWFNLADNYSAEPTIPDSSENIGGSGDSVGFVLSVDSLCEHKDIISNIPQNIKIGDSVIITFEFPEEMKATHKFYSSNLKMTGSGGLVATSPTTQTSSFALGEPITFDIEEVTGNISIFLNIKEGNLADEAENELGGIIGEQ